MVNIVKILILTLFGSLLADIHPENGAAFNYTQIFIQWDQIPNSVEYNLFIGNLNSGEELELQTNQTQN